MKRAAVPQSEIFIIRGLAPMSLTTSNAEHFPPWHVGERESIGDNPRSASFKTMVLEILSI